MFKGVASRALGVFALFTVVCGLGYTLVVTGISQLRSRIRRTVRSLRSTARLWVPSSSARTSMTKPTCGVVSRTCQLSKAKMAGSWRMVPRPICPRRVMSIGSLWMRT